MRAAIFDMDGLLIDSEPLWQEAEITLFNSLGVRLTGKLCRETLGMRVDEAVRHWFERFRWQGPSCEAVTQQLLDAAAHAIVERGSLMPGAMQVIAELRDRQFTLAIASSSPLRLIHAVVDRFELGPFFTLLHSAEHEAAGKPDPAVYRTVMSRLGVVAGQCVAFEDSLPGVRSAKAAGATVVAVPAGEDCSNAEFAIADLILGSLEEFSVDQILAR